MEADFFYFILALVLLISVHEFSHAWVANYFGDPTAKIMGRMTLNPFVHLDLIGTLLLLSPLHIGWGKPVPVDDRNFKEPVKHSAIVAFAGPISNLLIAILLALPLKYLKIQLPLFVLDFLWTLFDLSLMLFIFNMLPFPPLDGSKFYQLFIPKSWQRGYEYFLRHGVKFFVVFILLDMFLIRRILGFSILSLTLGRIFVLVKSAVLLGT